MLHHLKERLDVPVSRSNVDENALKSIASAERRQAAFEKLRSIAVKNLCRALIAGQTIDPDCVQACLAAISTRMYTSRDTK